MIRVLTARHLKYLPLPLLNILLKLKSKEITPILLYHAVMDQTDNNPLLSGKIHNVSPEIVYDQLSLLKRYFTILPLDELFEQVKSGRNLCGLGSITFDDGYKSVIENAIPTLSALDIPATIMIVSNLVKGGVLWRDKIRFIISKGLVEDFLGYLNKIGSMSLSKENFYIDSKNPGKFNSKQLDRMIEEYLKFSEFNLIMEKNIYLSEDMLDGITYKKVTFGNHTSNHYMLSGLTKEEQYQEIVDCETYLQSLNKETVKVLSIPFGGPDSYNYETISIAKKIGYRGVLLSDGKVNKGSEVSRLGMLKLDRFMPENDTKRYILTLLS